MKGQPIASGSGLLVAALAVGGCFGGGGSSSGSGDGGSTGTSSSSGASTGSSSGGSASGSSSGGSSGGASSSGSGGTSSSGSSTGSSSGSTGPQLGLVMLADDVGATAASSLYNASAQFPQSPSTSPPFCSTGTAAGSCCLTMPGGSAGDAGLPTYVSAGDITIADKGATLATLSFASGGYSAATSAQTASLTWTGGNTLMVSGAGATVPAFSGSVIAPARFAGLTPALAAAATAVTRNAGWTISWTPASQTGALVVLDLFPTGTSASHPNIGCQVQDSTGMLNVASSLLASFPTGAGTASLAKYRVARSSNGQVGLTAATAVRGMVTFQ